MNTLQTLEALAVDIFSRENAGDLAFFEALTAPHFAMRRSSGAVVDRRAFLAGVGPGGDRRCQNVPVVTLAGRDRALVQCRVAGGGVLVDNLLVFVRQTQASTGWLLLAWANERVEDTQ